MSRLRIMIADDEVLMRRVLADLLATDPALEVVGEAADASQAIELATRLQPDVALLDIKMPGGGLYAARTIGHMSPRTRILALTAYADRSAVIAMLRAGARGYMLKGSSAEDVLDAIHRISRDEGVLSGEVAAEVIRELAGTLDREEAEVSARQAQAARLRELLDPEGHALRVVVQPIVELGSGWVTGVEALLRVDSTPVRGPDVWFAEAQAVGLLPDLEMACVELTLAQCRELAAGVYLGVNLNPQSVMDPRIQDLLGEFEPGRLVIEVTEHAPIEDYEALNAALASIRARGGRLAVDDAGAGYASLRHILRLAPEIIKLDISLTRGIHADPKRRALAASLIAFAEEVGAKIVAEGIETRAELDALWALGVRYGQGYYLARPAPMPPGGVFEPLRLPPRGRLHVQLGGLREKMALIELLHTVITAGEAATAEEALQVAVDRVCAYTGWPVGHACLVPEGGAGELVSSGVWHVDADASLQAFRRASEPLRFGPGVGLPGRVLEAGGPVLLPELVLDPTLPRAEQAAEAGLGAGFGFPLVAGGQIVGVLEFFAREPTFPNAPLLEVMADFGRQLGRVLDRKRIERELVERQGELQAAQELAHVGSARWFPPDNAGSFSDEAYRIFGLEPGTGPRVFDAFLRYVHPDDMEGVARAQREALRTGGAALDFRIRRPDGAERTLRGLVRVSLDESGLPRMFSGVIQDITEFVPGARA